MPLRSAISRVPQRWVVCALCSLALAFSALKQNCYSTVVDIVEKNNVSKKLPSSECPPEYNDTVWANTDIPFRLPEVFRKKPVLRQADFAYAIGKSTLVIPAGFFSDDGGSRQMLVGSMALLSLCYFMGFVWGERSDTYVLLNLIEGALDAIVFCSIFTLIRRWSMPSERNMFTALVVSGLFYGHILGIGFFELTYLTFQDWKYGQIATGFLALLWLVFGYVFVYNSPADSPFVFQNNELHCAVTAYPMKTRRQTLTELKIIPWSKILFSRSFISTVLVFCSVNWAIFFNIKFTYVDYESYVLRLPESFSFTSSAVMIAAVPSTLMAGVLADTIVKHRLMSKTAVKRLFVFVGVIVPSLLQSVVAHIGCRIVLSWVLSTISTYIVGVANPVVYSTPIDLSPRNAGLLGGTMLGVTTIISLFQITIREFYFVGEYSSPSHLRTLIVVQAAISSVLAVPFLLFGTGEVQRWRRVTVHSNSITQRNAS